MKPTGKLSFTTRGDLVDLKKKSKVFPEGPSPPPLSPISPMETDLTTPDLNYIKQQSLLPLDKTYTDGLVKQTEKEGVVELAENLQKIKHFPTGAIIKEDFVPTGDQYTENFHYVVKKNLAKGSFGTTALCVDAGKRFIRKKIKKANFRSSEVVVPVNLNHENVTKLYGLILRQEEDGDLTVELMIEPAGEALNSFIKHIFIDTQKIWDITKQMMAGLTHLHLNGIIHLDIKPENVCVQMKGSSLLVKITDFGSAKKLPLEDITSVGMTPEYMAPEICKLFPQKRMKFERVITGKSDVFAGALTIMFLNENVHVLLRFITGGKTSYSDITQRKKLRQDLMHKLATDQKFIWQSVIPYKCDVDMRELLIQMTHYDHHRRLSAQEVMDFIDKRERRREEECNRTQTKDKMRKKWRQKLKPYAGKSKWKFGKEETPMQEMRRMKAFHAEEFLSLVNDVSLSMGKLNLTERERRREEECNRTQTKDKMRKKKTRQKLKPYAGKSKWKFGKEETPMQEMRRMQAFHAKEFLSLVNDVSLSMGKLNLKEEVSTSKQKAIVTQPLSEETHQGYQPKIGASRRVVLSHAQPATQTSAQRYHAQPPPQLACAPFSQQPWIQQPIGCYESNRISVIPETQTSDANADL